MDDYNKRINDNFLKAEYQDGEVLQHTDLNELENVVKIAINANYEDIQKLQDGTLNSGNSEKFDGATLSTLAEGSLEASDTTVPTSAQVKDYIDTQIGAIDLSGYASSVEVDNKIETVKSIYDSNNNGIVDNAELVNGHTVNKDVPSDAKFTDTIYDDTEVRELISDLDDDKVDKVTGKGLSTNDYTSAEKTKLEGIASRAQVNVIENIRVNGTNQSVTNKTVNISVPTQLSQLSEDNTHRLVTDDEKTNWNGKGTYSKPSTGIPKTDLASGVRSSLEKADTALQSHQDISGKEDKSNKVISINENSTDVQYPSAKSVYESQEEQNETINELETKLQETQAELDRYKLIENALPKVSGTGTSITLDNTANAGMTLELNPNMSQETTTGKNIFSSDSSIWIGNGAGKVNYDNATDIFTFHRDSGADYLIGGTKLQFKPSTTYTIMFDVIENTMTSALTRVASSSNLESGTINIPANTTGKFYATLVTTSSLTNTYDMWLYCNSTGTLKAKIMLVEGSYTSETFPSYEPYTGGIASPNPQYPQDIHTISGSNTIKVCGKNLLNLTNGSITNRGITGTIINNSILEYSGTATEAYANITSTINYTLPEGTYTFSIDKATTNNERIALYLTGGTAQTIVIQAGNTSNTFVSNGTNTSLRVGITNLSNGTSYNGIVKMQLENGTTATTYEPHQEQTAQLNLGDLEYSAIGNYKDQFYKATDSDTSLISGKWYLKKNIGKTLLNDLTIYTYTSATYGAYFYFKLPDMVNNASMVYCRLYKKVAISPSTWVDGSMVTDGTNTQVRDSRYSTREEFKAGVGDEYFYYPLATPTYIPLNDTLQSQLEYIYNQMLSYQGQTNITQVSNDLPFDIVATALKDLSEV